MRIRALAFRIIRQFLRDKRTLALLFLAPLLVLTLMHFVFEGSAPAPVVGLAAGSGPQEAAISQRLQQAGAGIREYAVPAEGRSALEDGDIDALLLIENGSPHIVLEGTDPAATKASLALLQRAMQPSAPADASGMNGVQISYLHGSASLSTFDSIGPVLVGLLGFFFVFLLAGVSFLRERTTGTLERLLATPIRRSEVVAGYLAGFGLFTLVQAALIAWYSTVVLGMYMEGSFWLLMLVNLLLALTALTLGTLLSTYAGNEFQIIQFIPIVIVPQIFFSGLFSLDAMNEWLRQLSWAMPLYYGADALRGVMLRGETFSAIRGDLAVLLGFSSLFALLNMLALKKQRSI
jgi:ABC-2 type transport system permease protein